MEGILLLISAAVCVYCGSQLYQKLEEYRESRQIYEELRKDAVQKSQNMDAASDTEADDDTIDIDWSALEGTGVVGWLRLGNIDYPIMQGEDNRFFLHHLPDGTYNYGGSLFLDADNSGDFSDGNSIIYGHNMADGSMFGSLKNMVSQKDADTTFDIYTPDGIRHRYQYYSVQYTTVNSPVYTMFFNGEDEFLAYLQQMKKTSSITTDPEPAADGKIVSLSTCNGNAGTRNRLVLQGMEMSSEQL